MANAAAASEQRALLLCPTGRDAELAGRMLGRSGINAYACRSMTQLLGELATGAGCLVLAEEALADAEIGQLKVQLGAQPPWSELPLLLLARPGADSWATVRAMELLGNVTILERPARVAVLTSAVRAALRDRERQYALARQLAEREHTSRVLAERDESLRMALAAGNMGAFDVDLATGESVWTEASFPILGFAPAPGFRASFDTWVACIDPEDRDAVLEQHDLARRNKARYVLEYRFIRPRDGRRIWLTAVGRFIYDQHDVAFRSLGVFFDSTRRRELEQDLRRVNANLALLVDERTRELRNLSHHLIEVAENEKRSLARELHDELGAMLTALSMDLDLIRRKADAPVVQDVATRAVDLVHSAAMVKRRIMEGLRPSVLDMMGLNEALKSLAGDFSRRTGIPCSVDRVEHVPDIDQRIAIALYRIVQEALTNVARYARAAHVEVCLAPRDGGLALTVTDDGIGVQEPAAGGRRSYGIAGMRERVSSLGGEFAILPGEQAHGTVVRVHIPHRGWSEGNASGSASTGGSGGEPGSEAASRRSAPTESPRAA
ncbi:MAG: PAS domain-containing protein [Casimicrobiaceae bacterium]